MRCQPPRVRAVGDPHVMDEEGGGGCEAPLGADPVAAAGAGMIYLDAVVGKGVPLVAVLRRRIA